MSFEVVNVGTVVNDRTGDPLRTAMQKINTNFELLDANDALTERSGSASPEGSIPARPGLLYWDAVNRILYVKDTGTGSTGWQELLAI